MTFEEFELKVEKVKDLELSWVYWNCMLSEITGYAILQLFILPGLRQLGK